VPHLVIAALLVTLAAGSAAILILDRYLRERSPELFRAVLGNLVLFNLLTALGLGLRLVEQGLPAPDGGAALHLLAAQIVVLAILKVAWLRSFVALGLALTRRVVSRRVDVIFACGAAAAALAALGGWVQAAWMGRLSISLAVAIATDFVVLGGMTVVAALLWHESASTVGLAARRAQRWFSAGTLTVVACIGLSFGAGATWASWQGAVQALAHSLILFAYEILLVAWTMRWADTWAAETKTIAGESDTLERAVSRYGLSKREREVAVLLCHGRTNQEIADELFVALQTIKDHNYRIFQKVGVRNRTELARRLMLPGLDGETH
jgi:DNA-binding CsgD family transcriptional regulator